MTCTRNRLCVKRAFSVAVANTPIFLARRLLENAAVRQAHQLHGAEKIFAALQKISARKPSDLNEAAEAYFYLVALSLDDNKLWLRRAGVALSLRTSNGSPTLRITCFWNCASYSDLVSSRSDHANSTVEDHYRWGTPSERHCEHVACDTALGCAFFYSLALKHVSLINSQIAVACLICWRR